MAKLLTSDYCEQPAEQAARSFKEHHQVDYSSTLIRSTSLKISDHANDVEQEWVYALPDSIDLKSVRVVSLSRDGAMIHLLDGKSAAPKQKAGYRESMCGVMCLYDDKQQLLHSIYIGVGPQKGKGAFTDLFELEANRLKTALKHAGNEQVVYVGVADGAKDNWTQLDCLTDYQVTDYYHVTERLYKLSNVLPMTKGKREEWVKTQKKKLLKCKTGAKIVLRNAKKAAKTVKTQKRQDIAAEQITYLANQQKRMHYKQLRAQHLPIGSGTVEAGCKTLIKKRMCGSGMRWLNCYSDDLLIIRALKITPGRYEQYWKRKMENAA